MRPLLAPGQEILASRQRTPKPGEIWVLMHPGQPRLKIVKSVTERHSTGAFEVRGLNPTRSEDSRQFGLAPPELFLGRVESLFWSANAK